MVERTKSRGFGDMNPGGDSKAKRPEELAEFLKVNGDFLQIRLIGDVEPYAQRWIDIETAKGVISIPKVALNFNRDTDSFDDTIEDPYKDIPNPQRVSRSYYFTAIVRDLQDDEPRRAPEPSREERKSGFKQMGSKAWTPVKAFRVPAGCGKLFQKLQTMNKHKVKGKVTACQVSDPEYGCDVFISYDADAPGAAKYNIQKGDHSPLTDDELKYLSWDLSNLMEAETLEVAKREATALASKSPDVEEEEEEEEEEDSLGSGKGKGRRDRSDRAERSSSRSSRDKPDRSDRASRTKDRESSRSASRDKPARESSRSSTRDKPARESSSRSSTRSSRTRR